MATVSANKLVSFDSPYIGKTFQKLASTLFGQDGYLSGGETTDDGVNIAVQPVVFVQRGILVTTTAAATGIAVPTVAEPWFMIASTADDGPATGAMITVTADPGAAAAAVVVAFKSNGRWQGPPAVDIATAGQRSSEPGPERDVELRSVLDGSDNVTAIEVLKGMVVDPAGDRRALASSAANSGIAASITPTRPHPVRARTDHAVLRQLDPRTSQVMHLMGGTASDESAISPITLGTVAAPAKRPSYVAKRGGSLGEQWWAWSDGAHLRIQGGPAGEAFAATALLTAGGVIGATAMVGQRSSDGALVIAYVDGLDLKLVSFNAATGALVDGPVTLVAVAEQISYPRAVLDRSQQLHIAFQRAEAKQQIYYMRCGITAGASFGAIALAPRYVAGSATATNDTWPSIGLARTGVVTIAHIQGTGTNEYGDLIVATIDSSGNTSQRKLVEAAADVGIDTAASSAHDLPNGNGAVATVLSRFQRTSVVVTPHDDVYVFTVGSIDGVSYIHSLIYNVAFEKDLGFSLLNFAPAVSGASLTAIGAAAGEQGEIAVALKEVAPANVTEIVWYILNPRPMDGGRAGMPVLTTIDPNSLDGRTETSGFGDLLLAKGPTGGVVANYVLDQDVLTADVFTINQEILGRHPQDLYLGSWTVPPAAAAQISGVDRRFEIFNTRHKRMNYPFLVGDGGDYQGYSSIYQAAAEAGRVNGEIVVRSGMYELNAGALQLYGPLRGEGKVVLLQKVVGSQIVLGSVWPADVPAIAGNIVAGTTSLLNRLRPGSLIKLAVSGYHVVLRNFGFDSVSGKFRVLVEPNESGAPVGATDVGYFGGLGLEGVCIVGEAATCLVIVQNAFQPTIQSVDLEGTIQLQVNGCMAAVLDQIDLARVATNTVALLFSGGDGSSARSVRLADGRGRIQVNNDCQNVCLTNCHSDGLIPADAVYVVQAGRTTPVFMVDCRGRFQGEVADLVTNVGQLVRVPEAGDALRFEDDYTRASTITDKAIKLTSNAAKEFNGATKDVVTSSVNERVLRAGDSMTGALVNSADITAALFHWTGNLPKTIPVSASMSSPTFAGSGGPYHILATPPNVWTMQNTNDPIIFPLAMNQHDHITRIVIPIKKNTPNTTSLRMGLFAADADGNETSLITQEVNNDNSTGFATFDTTNSGAIDVNLAVSSQYYIKVWRSAGTGTGDLIFHAEVFFTHP